MIDDTRDNASVLNDDPQTFLAEVTDLFQLRSDRNYAYNWSRDLKLLTLDDVEHSGPIDDVQHSTRCAQCVASGEEIDPTKPIKDKTQVWMCNACREGPYFLGGRYHCSTCDGGDYDLCARCVSKGVHCEDSTHKLLYSPLVCQHMAAHSCSSCMYMPLFPEKATIKEFKIVKQSDLLRAKTQCTHFVAVSYCWPHDEGTANPQYRVRDENGNTRPNRAPNSVLDRAVAFARENGMRFIWIDQVDSNACFRICDTNNSEGVHQPRRHRGKNYGNSVNGSCLYQGRHLDWATRITSSLKRSTCSPRLPQ